MRLSSHKLTGALGALIALGAVFASTASAVFPGTNGRIFFSSDRDSAGVRADIFSMNPDGSDVRNLTPNSTVDAFDVGVSADGTRIAYVRNDANLDLQVVVANADGSNAQQITSSPGDKFTPRFSPDGTKLTFTANDGDNEIFVMGVDGSNPVNLTNNSAADIDSEFSPDGTLITFASKRDEPAQFDVFTMKADGSDPRNLTGVNGAFDADPSFSPDGSTIVFRSNRTTDNQIFVMTAGGENETNLTNDTEANAAPTFSPDGTRIAFGVGQGDDEINVMNADGSNQQEVGSSEETSEGPDWSRVPLAVTVAGKGRQVVNKLAARVTCSIACDVAVSADGRAGRKFTSNVTNKTLQPGVATNVRVRFRKKVLKRIDDRKGRATFDVVATDAFGTAAGEKAVKLKK